MTIHCAITYFDLEANSAGYLLGSDSRAALDGSAEGISAADAKVFHVDKSFRGKNSVGFIRGIIPVKISNPEDDFSRQVHSLDDIFDTINDGTDYAHVPVLTLAEKYVLLVGKKTEGSLELYTISNLRKRNPHVARRLHRLTADTLPTEKESLLWYAPNKRDYFVIGLRRRIGAQEAQDFLEKLLRIPSHEVRAALEIPQDMELGQPRIYRLDFQGITRIQNNT